ncbi:MAG: hypothetical protein AAF799_06855 [Myxococcota bacterium]
MRTFCFLALASVFGGCHGGSASSAPGAADEVQAPAAGLGELIYRGEVVPQGHDTVDFVYERWVSHGDEEWTSAHLTRAAGSEALLVAQHAVHSPDYALRRFDEVHRQTGTVSSVLVHEDGRVDYETTRGGRVKRRTEAAGVPVVVGPTLFGFVRRHWEALERGEAVPLRFAAADRARSYGFTLRRGEAGPGTTTIEMVADQALVRWSVGPMFMVFDTQQRTIVRYVGRVPPRLDERRAIGARVDYEQVATVYR